MQCIKKLHTHTHTDTHMYEQTETIRTESLWIAVILGRKWDLAEGSPEEEEKHQSGKRELLLSTLHITALQISTNTHSIVKIYMDKQTQFLGG